MKTWNVIQHPMFPQDPLPCAPLLAALTPVALLYALAAKGRTMEIDWRLGRLRWWK